MPINAWFAIRNFSVQTVCRRMKRVIQLINKIRNKYKPKNNNESTLKFGLRNDTIDYKYVFDNDIFIENIQKKFIFLFFAVRFV